MGHLGAHGVGYLGIPLLLPSQALLLHRVRVAVIDRLRTHHLPGWGEKAWVVQALETAWREQACLRLQIFGGRGVSTLPWPCVRV